MEQESKEIVEEKLRNVLEREFQDPERKKVLVYHDRLGFCCPYCGDSHEDVTKRRGNIYLDSGFYHCFNDGCGVHKPVIKVLKEFDEPITDTTTITNILRSAQEFSSRSKWSGPVEKKFGDIKRLYDISVDRDELISKKGLVDPKKSERVRKMIRKEFFITNDELVALDQEQQQLYFFNTTPDGKVCGYQLRNLRKKNPKFLSFHIFYIWERDFGEVPDVERTKSLETLSLLFGIFNTDFSREFFVFEGPTDSFLYKNSVATVGVGKEIPFSKDRAKFFYDFDSAGLEKMYELCKDGFSVFMWGKFLNDHGLSMEDKWDLKDIYKESFRRNDPSLVKRTKDYFSTSKLDLFYVGAKKKREMF